jgi:hypothetical protein
LSEGFEQNHRGLGLLRIGIDARWVVRSPGILLLIPLHISTWLSVDAELDSLFYKLCELLRYSVTAVFVFQGPAGPGFKRGRPIPKDPETNMKIVHPLTMEFKSMVKAFGFYYYTVSQGRLMLQFIPLKYIGSW